jgi:predicted lysophospholipase L1 biosynthesis ABC-type transport system permease subunit
VAAGATVPIGVSAAAAVTSSMSISERVALAAWVVVGVVGTASVVSAAAILRGRRPRRQREQVVEKTGNGRKRETTTR